VIPDWAMQAAAEQDIQLTVFARHHLESIEKFHALSGRPVKVHIKIDTGMHRIGLDWREAVAFVRHCQAQPYIRVEGLFTHLAAPGNPAVTQTQLARWEEVIGQIDPLPRHLHVFSTTGAMLYPEATS